MRPTFSTDQFNKFETVSFRDELPLIVARARSEFPKTFQDVSDEYIGKFALSALEISQKFGKFNDFDKIYDLMIINAHGKLITENVAASAYFKSIITSEDMTLADKVGFLKKNLWRYFERANA